MLTKTPSYWIGIRDTFRVFYNDYCVNCISLLTGISVCIRSQTCRVFHLKPSTIMILCDTDEIYNLWPIIFYDFQFETGRLEINIMVSWMSDILSFYREWDVRKSSKTFQLLYFPATLRPDFRISIVLTPLTDLNIKKSS